MANRRLVVKYLLVILWMTGIFFMSNEVANTSSARSAEIVQTIQSIGINAPEGLLTFLVRKAAHITAYFILGILFYALLREYRISTKRTILLSILFAMLYAGTDELHQVFVSGRSGEFRDILIDTIGATIGIVIYSLITHKKKPADEEV